MTVGIVVLVLLLYFYVNTLFFMLYGYHIDGMVLNLLLNSDTAGSIDLNTGTYMSVAIRLALFLLPIGVMFTGAEIFRRIRILSVRTSLFLVMIVFFVFAAEKTIYSYGMFVGNTAISSMGSYLGPFYIMFSSRKI